MINWVSIFIQFYFLLISKFFKGSLQACCGTAYCFDFVWLDFNVRVMDWLIITILFSHEATQEN